MSVFINSTVNTKIYNLMSDEHQIITITDKEAIVENIGTIVSGDTNSCLLTFEINRFQDGIDLSDKKIRFNYRNSNGKFYDIAVNVKYNDDVIRFSWLLPYSLTQPGGNVIASIEFYGFIEYDEEYSYKTKNFKLSVEKSLGVDDGSDESYNNWSIKIENDVEVIQKKISEIEKDIKSIHVPTKLSELTNDSNYQTADDVSNTLDTVLEPYAKSVDVTREIITNIATKLDKNQGASNSGKITGINESGDIVPMFPQGVTYNENTQCLEYGADEKLNLNAGIQLDDTLSKVGYAADAASVGELKGDLGDVRCDFYTETKSKNLFDPSKVQEQKGIDSSGVIYTDASFDISDRIPVLANTHVVFSDDSQSALFLYGYYKTDGTFVERISKRGFIPTYDGYIVLRFAHGSDVSKVQVEYNTEMTAYEPYGTTYLPKNFATEEYVKNEFETYELPNDSVSIESVTFKDVYSGGNLINKEKLVANQYVNGGTDGGLKTANGMYVTDYIPVQPNTQYYFNYNYLYNGYCAFYDANKNYISGYGVKTSESYLTTPFKTPDNCVFARFTIAKASYIEHAWLSRLNRMTEKPSDYELVLKAKVEEINLSPTEYKGDDICIFNKILCIGDSLTDGFFNENGGSRLIMRNRSYPTKLQKITGVECTNMGYAGYTSKQWYDAYKDTDLSGHDCCIIQLGVNDALKSSSTAETTQALTDIITKVKSENDGIKIFVATITPANGYMLESMRVMSETIRTIVNNLNDANLYLVDLWKYGHTADLLAFDSGHLSAYGYYQLACDYKAYISYIIKNNPNDFRYVQFIGTSYSFNGDNNTRSITY